LKLYFKLYDFQGDGGNDISMIQAANTGIGIVGKEGLQASLAADFSLTQFSHISKLLLVSKSIIFLDWLQKNTLKY